MFPDLLVPAALLASCGCAHAGAALWYLASRHQKVLAEPWQAPRWFSTAAGTLTVAALAPLLLALSPAVAVFVWITWLMLGLTLAPFVGLALARRRTPKDSA